MNILTTVSLLEKAKVLFDELKASGVLEEIQTSIEKDKEIIAKLQADGKLQEFIKEAETFLEGLK